MSTAVATASALGPGSVASPVTTTVLGLLRRRSSLLAGSRSRTTTRAPAATKASWTARPMPDPAPTTRTRFPTSISVFSHLLMENERMVRFSSRVVEIVVLGPERLAQEPAEQVVALPGEGLQLERVEVDRPLVPGRLDAQADAVAGLDTAHHDRGELV